MNNATPYETALQQIRETGFALHELVLYLDTHPANRKALSLYKTYKKKYDELYAAFEKNHGPLTAFGVHGDRWTWTEHPWPWQNCRQNCLCTPGENARPWKGDN
ncbi:MAG: spore coat protein CotJB [Clostridia bacterium]|nr:spore coat protein CotJB [Clostridia bacterium]